MKAKLRNIKAFDRLSQEAYGLLDSGEVERARDRVLKAQREFEKGGLHQEPKCAAMLAARLIDVGGAARDEELVAVGVDIYASNAALRERMSLAMLEYNLGNGKRELYNIERQTTSSQWNLESMSRLTEAKNHYWRSIQEKPDDEDLLVQVYVNLANSLNQASRIAESLRWYREALRVDPDFGMALINRGDALMYLGSLSGGYSVSLMVEAMHCFERAASSPSTLPDAIASAVEKRDLLQEYLAENHEWTEEAHDVDRAETTVEAKEHSPYWNFCLENFLALSEHSLHCHCIGARRDDLAIPTRATPLPGEFVPRCELLLNRLKSEFCLARMLFFQGTSGTASEDFDRDFEGTYSELWENEAIGMRSEFLRTSFRLCFGILDRIAQGVNELFSVAKPGEHLYFDSFWRPRGKGAKGAEQHWNMLNQNENTGLMALYSLATDLNRKGGEFGILKETRNDLEHGLVVLLEGDDLRLPADAKPERIEAKLFRRAEFEERCLHLLQFTSSAIFSFVYTVRQKAWQIDAEGPALTVTLGKKDIGKR